MSLIRRHAPIADEIWVEKYRPHILDEVVGQEIIIERLQSYVRTGSMPHLMFSGPAGVGKTASAVALAREFFGDSWGNNFTELNASDDRGIDVVRKNIKTFARTPSIGGAPFKIIFLDEADALTNDAQSALRRTMERYSQTCRFILSCNYSSKIIGPIQSRCAVYRFRPMQDGAVEQRLRYIVQQENIEITGDGLHALIYVAQGDMRRAINSLQSAAVLGKKIDAEAVYKTTATASPEDIRDLITTAMEGDLKTGLRKLNNLLLEQGLSGDDLVAQLHRAVFDLDTSNENRVRLLDRIGETNFRLVEGGDEKIQLEALIAYMVLMEQ